VFLRDGGDLSEVRQAYRLTAARVVRDGDHDEGDARLAVLRDGFFELRDVDVPLERVLVGAVEGFVDHAVHGGRLAVEDVPPGGVEGHVEGDDVALLDERAEDDVFGCAPLMDGNGVVEAEHLLDCLLQVEEAVGAGVGLVAHHDGGPLLLAHRACSGVGEEVDIDVRAAETEHVETGCFKRFLALVLAGNADRFYHLDAKRLGGYLHDHEFFPPFQLRKDQVSSVILPYILLFCYFFRIIGEKLFAVPAGRFGETAGITVEEWRRCYIMNDIFCV